MERIRCEYGTVNVRDEESVVHVCKLDVNGAFTLPEEIAFPRADDCTVTGVFVRQAPVYVDIWAIFIRY